MLPIFLHVARIDFTNMFWHKNYPTLTACERSVNNFNSPYRKLKLEKFMQKVKYEFEFENIN